MRTVSFRIRRFEEEQFLTYDIDNESSLDDTLLDFLEEEEPKGIVPIIFEDGEEFDTFSYDITDKIRLCELLNQEMSAELVLNVLRELVLAFINMGEYRVPFSYLVLHRDYIYVDENCEVEFICVPLEELQEEVDLNVFLRNFLASLRYDASENGDYVAKLLTHINNTAIFTLHNLLALIEELMDAIGVELSDNAADVYADYQEMEENKKDSTDSIVEMLEELEQDEEDLEVGDLVSEKVVSETEESSEEEALANEKAIDEELSDELSDEKATDEELNDEASEQEVVDDEDEPKLKKNVKVNRASVVMNNRNEWQDEVEDEDVVSNSILSQTVGTTGVLKAVELPKANPYLIRINTEERIMITKQNFKIGKASMGVDYTVKGNSAVSRVHAVISSKDDIYYVRDNKSTNHTFVNGKILDGGESELLTHDCKIVLGDEEFVFKLR